MLFLKTVIDESQLLDIQKTSLVLEAFSPETQGESGVFLQALISVQINYIII